MAQSAEKLPESEEVWVRTEVMTIQDKAMRKALFRSDIERVLKDINRVATQHQPEAGQTFTLAPDALEELLRRGIITQEQFKSGEIDRAAVVAAVLIKRGQDDDFLSNGKIPEAMELIRKEEEKHLAALKRTE